MHGKPCNELNDDPLKDRSMSKSLEPVIMTLF